MAEHGNTTHIKKIDGRWRVMDASGTGILKAGNKKGNAASDGGGHATYAEALAQLRGIERSKHGG